jgi:hypothetical protein
MGTANVHDPQIKKKNEAPVSHPAKIQASSAIVLRRDN